MNVIRDQRLVDKSFHGNSTPFSGTFIGSLLVDRPVVGALLIIKANMVATEYLKTESIIYYFKVQLINH